MTPEERALKVCEAYTSVYTYWGDLPSIVAAAIREAVHAALDDAAKVVRTSCVENGLWSDGEGTTNGFEEPDLEAIAAAIEALKT